MADLYTKNAMHCKTWGVGGGVGITELTFLSL